MNQVLIREVGGGDKNFVQVNDYSRKNIICVVSSQGKELYYFKFQYGGSI